MRRTLKQGDSIHAIRSPLRGEYGESAGAEVGSNGVTKITIGCLEGPMGLYAVAEVYGEHGLETVWPLMHMETITVRKQDQPF